MIDRPPGTVKRTSGIGGSDVSVICGLSQYKTPYQLYLEKRGELVEEREDTTRLRFGRRLEKPVADEFAFVTGRKLWRERITQRHPEHPEYLANIDRWQRKSHSVDIHTLGMLGVYEGKTADWTQRPIWTQGGIPDSYYLQLQWYLYVTGCDFGSYGILFGLDDFHFFDVERDQVTIDTLSALAADFWRRVKESDPPDYTYGKTGAALAKRLYAKATPKKQIVLEGAEVEVKIRRLLQLKEAIKQRESEERDLTTWLQVRMQDAEIAHFYKVAKIVWSNQTRKLVNMDRLKVEYPEIVALLTEEKASRRFTISATDQEPIKIEEAPDAPLIIMSGVRAIELD